jgi:hypothetical protein
MNSESSNARIRSTALAVVLGLLCMPWACSLRSLDYLTNGHKQDGAAMDGAERDVAAPRPPSPDTSLVEVVRLDALAADGTGEPGGDGTGEAMSDSSTGGGEADSAQVGDATGDASDDIALGGAGEAGGIDTGGMWATGGDPSTGGSLGSGGIAATGGTWAMGGSAGTDGLVATGGLSATGGVTATGGITATGGVLATGGTPATGGATGTGGSSSVACAGVPYARICWYLASVGSSCTQACADHGGPSSLAAGHVGTAAQGGSPSECATILLLLGLTGTVQSTPAPSGVGCSRNTGTLGPGPGLYWCTTPVFSETASLPGMQPACGCLR